MSKVRFVGLDVHAETISIAVAEGDEVRSLGVIPNRLESRFESWCVRWGRLKTSAFVRRLVPPATCCIGNSRSSARRAP